MFVIRKHLRPTSFVFPLARYLKKTSGICSSKSLSTTQGNCADDEDNGLQENPFYEKYKHKIKEVKTDVNVTPKDRYNKALQHETRSWKRNIENLEKRFTDKRKGEGKISGLRLPANLDELTKIDLFLDKSADDISDLWTKYWSGKDTICAVISKDVYDTMATRIKECPLFLYPLPREQGYEFYLTQFSECHCFCTSLINYQAHGEEAPWQLCFKFYPELKESKGVVLMASEYDSCKMSILEVQYLAQLQQLFYANANDKRYELMKTFNHHPDSFKYMDVVKEIESGDFIVRK